MSSPPPQFPVRTVYLLVACALVTAGGFGFFAFKYLALKSAEETLTEKLAETQDTQEKRFAALEEKVGIVTHESQKATESLEAARARSKTLEAKVNEKIENISGTVGNLEKLSKTDPQLLQKYSKVYFLNENYLPEDLTIIDEAFDFKDGKEVRVHSEMWPFLEKLLEAAKKEGISLLMLSGYRSFDEQKALKGTYKVTYGAGTANQFSADQGYSEHQLGTAIDFTTSSGGSDLSKFESSSAYAWLLAHAYEYGFVLSYPKGNAYYMYEPWHWRFVGIKLATDLHEQGKNFYDLDQRKIDEYLVELFER